MLPTAFDNVERMRVVNTPAGLLHQRDPERLRRYILDAPDEVQQAHRQQVLLDTSFSTLSLWPQTPSSSSYRQDSRVVNMGLFAWPVLVSHGCALRVRQAFSMNTPADAPLQAALGAAWAQALGVANTAVRPVGAINVQRLAGISPLTLQTCLSRESRRLAGVEGQPDCSDLFGLDLAAQQDPFMPMVPEQAAVFLFTAYVAWGPKKSRPTCSDLPGMGVDRMHELMTAVFTHGLKQSAGASVTCRSAPAAVLPYAPRQVLTPIIHLGQAQPLHDAVTQGQWMQIAWMAQLARRTARQFHLSQTQQGDFLSWSASLFNDHGEEDSTLNYTYDAFWRPLDHVQTILDRVDLAQGSGQMPSEELRNQLLH